MTRALRMLAVVSAFVACATAGAAKPAKPTKPVKPASPVKTYAVIEMKKGGKIVAELFTKQAPLTAGNFIKLAKKGFYNGLTFHRVEPGQLIQGGDPLGNGTGGPGYTIKLEKSATQLKHDVGVLSMARATDPDSAGSQFFILMMPRHDLDGSYAVFGKVVSGMDVVRRVQRGDVMKSVRIVTGTKP